MRGLDHVPLLQQPLPLQHLDGDHGEEVEVVAGEAEDEGMEDSFLWDHL